MRYYYDNHQLFHGCNSVTSAGNSEHLLYIPPQLVTTALIGQGPLSKPACYPSGNEHLFSR